MIRALERSILFAGVALVAVDCQRTPAVTLEIDMPKPLADMTTWLEVGVLPGGCLSPAELAGGLPDGGLLAREAFSNKEVAPAFGNLAKGSYGFAAVARGADCTVLGTGCSVADVSSARSVSIDVEPIMQGGGACTATTTCVDARCVPSVDDGGVALGADCSLRILGGGPLADPLDLSGSDMTSGPAIVPTETGFLLAYREYDQLNGQARLTVAAVDSGGGLTMPTPTTLPGQCPQQDESDGVGLGYAQGSGMVVSTRPQCQKPAPGFDTFQVDGMGNVQKSSFTTVMGAKPLLSNAHALAVVDPSTALLAYLESNAAGLASVSGLAETSPSAFGGTPPHTESLVAANAQTVALLAVGTGMPSGDAGMSPEGGGSGSTARLELGASASATKPAVPPFPASWAALAVDGTRAFVMTDGPAGGSQVAWIAADLGAQGPSASGTFAAPGMGTVIAGDVAFRGDTLAFVVEQSGSLSVVGFTNASTTPMQTQAVSLSTDAHLPSMKTVRDGRVAIASNGTQVGVVWLTAKAIGPNDPLGGYAVLACSK